ncbi:MAG: aminopeptidase P family protein [candidate division Zixibacteria bacterium]|nr:aminopeptidase P family protein [candidate division Zixibacteria bacterium]
MSNKRVDLLRKKLAADNIDALVVTNMPQVRYLTGFSGSSGVLIITPKNGEFITDFRYNDQAKAQVKGASVTISKGDSFTAIKDQPSLKTKNLRVGFSGEFVSVSARERLVKYLPDALLVNADSVLSDLGWVKDGEEIAHIKKAAAIADVAFERILNIVKPGITEKDLAAELEYQMLMLGSERPAFETIVASGYRSAMPHGVASAKKVKKGDFVTFDFGATIEGSVCDITRTVVVGKATGRQKKIYDIVLKSQVAGCKKIRAGIPGKAVDDVCRQIITKAGYGKNFGHGTGHGIGIFIHMGPRLSQLSPDKLLPNNVVTVEPGIYISGWGGVRIEDDVVVTPSGGQVINRAEKKLLEL